MITVGELKKLLEQFDEKDIVVLSSDEEGNNFSPMYSGITKVTYSPSENYVYLRELDEEAIGDGYTEEDLYAGKDGLSAIVIYPLQ